VPEIDGIDLVRPIKKAPQNGAFFIGMTSSGLRESPEMLIAVAFTESYPGERSSTTDFLRHIAD
jgi:hypothetical protein